MGYYVPQWDRISQKEICQLETTRSFRRLVLQQRFLAWLRRQHWEDPLLQSQLLTSWELLQ
jgi:hypothetical protein